MAENSPDPPLPRRVRGETSGRRTGPQTAPVRLSEDVVRRILTALDATKAAQAPRQNAIAGLARPAHDRAVFPQRAGQEQAAPTAGRTITDPATARAAAAVLAAAPGAPSPAGPAGPAGLRPAGQVAKDAIAGRTEKPLAAAMRTQAARTKIQDRGGKAWAPGAVPGLPPAPGHRRHRLAGRVLVGVVLLAAGSVAFGLTGHATTATSRHVHRASFSAGITLRDRAAAWVAGQVSRTATVFCDRVMCQALQAAGVPAAAVLQLRPGTADPLRSGVVVATPAVRGMLGSRLSSIYAPAVIASFGSGSTAISIRVIAPHGAAAYSSQLAADVSARKEFGTQLLASGRITASATARRQLTVGLADSRLLVTIASLAARAPVLIVGFGDLAADASPGIPLRSADLAETGGPAQVRQVLAFLRAQSGPYLSGRVQSLRLTGGQDILRIQFAAPSPLGLLNPSSGGR